jgi:hypothetical protein
MANIIGELLFGIARFLFACLIDSFVIQVAQKVLAWLDTKVHGRRAKIVVGCLLGAAAYFLAPLLLVR